MNATIEKLKAAGCDTDTAMPRFLDDESFYLSMLGMALSDPAFEQLGEALKSNDLKKSFELSHLLKGVLANLELTPLCEANAALTEPLRRGENIDYSDKYEKLMDEKAKIAALVGEKI